MRAFITLFDYADLKKNTLIYYLRAYAHAKALSMVTGLPDK